VFVVEAGESRTPPSASVPELVCSLLDQLAALGETARRLKETIIQGSASR
jgi:hypothetical protein